MFRCLTKIPYIGDMKTKILAITAILALMVIGCVPDMYTNYAVVCDFRPYTQKGFLITTLDYHGEYESIGLVEVINYHGYKEESFTTNKAGYGEAPTLGQSTVLKMRYATPETLVESMYQKAVSIGANAMIDLHIQQDFVMQKYGSEWVRKSIGYTGTGLAIRRK